MTNKSKAGDNLAQALFVYPSHLYYSGLNEASLLFSAILYEGVQVRVHGTVVLGTHSLTMQTCFCPPSL